MILMPPRHGKSEFASHRFPVHVLELFPYWKIVLASYGADFAATWGRKIRNTISENADKLTVRVAPDSAAAARWETTKGGGVNTAGVGGEITGKGCNLLIVDDPVKNDEEAQSPVIREKAWRWWQSTAYTRLEPDGRVIVIQTRWHEDDLAGRIIAQHEQHVKDGIPSPWVILDLPALAEDANDLLGRSKGEALWPQRYSRDKLIAIKNQIGEYIFSCLYQQRPVPEQGLIFKREWMVNQYYETLPSGNYIFYTTWDFGSKGLVTSDYTVGQCWAFNPITRDYFLIEQVRHQLEYNEAEIVFEQFVTRCNVVHGTKLHIVEDKANGTPILSRYQKIIPNLIPYDPKGVSKIIRYKAMAPMWQTKHVWLPRQMPDIFEFTKELHGVPTCKNDDQIDAAINGQIHMENEYKDFVLPIMNLGRSA